MVNDIKQAAQAYLDSPTAWRERAWHELLRRLGFREGSLMWAGAHWQSARWLARSYVQET